MNYIKNRYFAVWFAFCTSLLALLSTIFCDHLWLLTFVEEGNFIENLTLVFYLAAIFFILFYQPHKIRFRYRFAITSILFAMLAREADLHKIFGISMLKIKYWLTNSTSMGNKFIAVLILLFITSSILYIIINNYKIWRKDLTQKSPYAITILTFFIALIVSKILDRSLGMINEITGWVAPIWLNALQQPQEEYLECILPLLIIVATIQYVDNIREN